MQEVSAAAHDNHADTATATSASLVGFMLLMIAVLITIMFKVVVVHLKTTLHYFATCTVVTIFPETTDFLLCFCRICSLSVFYILYFHNE